MVAVNVERDLRVLPSSRPEPIGEQALVGDQTCLAAVALTLSAGNVGAARRADAVLPNAPTATACAVGDAVTPSGV